jgi:hypothetical protein
LAYVSCYFVFLLFLFLIHVIIPYKPTGGTALNLCANLKQRKTADQQAAKQTVCLNEAVCNSLRHFNSHFAGRAQNKSFSE